MKLEVLDDVSCIQRFKHTDSLPVKLNLSYEVSMVTDSVAHPRLKEQEDELEIR